MLQFRNLLLFTVILLAILWIAELSFDFLIKKNYDFKPSLVASGALNAEILIQGPSRAVYGVDPRIISEHTELSCYNMGMNASPIEEHIALLHLYLENNHPPELILLEVHRGYLQHNNLTFHAFNYVPFLDNKFLSEYIRNYEEVLYYLNMIPLLKYSLYNRFLINEVIKGFFQFITSSKEINFISGFQPKLKTWTKLSSTSPKNLQNVDIEDSIAVLYDYYFKLASENNIKVIVFSAPYYGEGTADDQYVKALADRGGALYLNVNTVEVNDNAAFFYDHSHLNAAGAKRFSEIFSDKLMLLE